MSRMPPEIAPGTLLGQFAGRGAAGLGAELPVFFDVLMVVSIEMLDDVIQ
ncbi:hypothetical protein [uncultured Deefgea sp.]|nr:hypothetical protein [uncultured Deefgea sp.]